MVREQVITKNLVNRCYMLDAQPPSILKSKQKKRKEKQRNNCLLYVIKSLFVYRTVQSATQTLQTVLHNWMRY